MQIYKLIFEKQKNNVKKIVVFDLILDFTAIYKGKSIDYD